MRSSASQLERLWRASRRAAVVAVLAGAAVLYVAFEDGDALALGLILGGTASVLRYALRYSALLRIGGSGAGGLVRSRFYGYFVNAAALLVAFLARPAISPWSAIAGLFVMNACVVATELLTAGHRKGRASVRENR